MERPSVVLVAADVSYCRELGALLNEVGIAAAILYSLEDLPEHLRRKQIGVLILDLDTLPVDNNFFRKLKKQYHNLHILCVSSRTYHPGLEEALGSHICACLTKPLDPEEFHYWMKRIAENMAAGKAVQP